MPARPRAYWLPKPRANQKGVVPKPLLSPRQIKVPLLPRVERLVNAGVVPRPPWLDVAIAHPPRSEDKMIDGKKPARLEWREEDLLRRTWQRRNPEAATLHAKVLFLDEAMLPAGTKTQHPADEFVRRQMALMRRGLSEEEAYRRVQQHLEGKRRATGGDVADARARASALGASPAEGPGSAAEGGDESGSIPTPRGFAEQLLRRFAEEAREAGEPYPQHWFDGGGGWRGIGDAKRDLTSRTMRAINRTGRSTGLLETLTMKEMMETASKGEAEAEAAMTGPVDPSEPDGKAAK